MSKDDNNKPEEIFVQFENLISQLNLIKNQINGFQQNIRNIEKLVKKHMKSLKKEVVKTKVKNKGNRQPSGFAKPTKVTKELCEFMNKAEGTEIARTDVTRSLVTYIKENKLENTENSRVISPDDKLKILLGIEDEKELTYFNIQNYMNKHFIKNAKL